MKTGYRLKELEAEFLKSEGKTFYFVPTRAEASGVWFICPKCFDKNGGPVGSHRVICWFVGKVDDDMSPGPGRWTPAGEAIEDLTFVPGDPARPVSVLLESSDGGCGWHGFIRNGEATFQ